MRLIIVWVLAIAACGEGSARVVRWPEHRHRHDDQLERLQAITQTQERVLVDLAARIAKLEAALRAQPAAPTP